MLGLPGLLVDSSLQLRRHHAFVDCVSIRKNVACSRYSAGRGAHNCCAALALGKHAICGVQHKLSATGLAAMVLFAVVNMASFLEAGGATCGAGVSDDHGYR
jgi:hypothetical protein